MSIYPSIFKLYFVFIIINSIAWETIIEYTSLMNKISNNNTILKIKSLAKLKPDSHVTAGLSENKSE